MHEKTETIKRGNKEETIYKIALAGQASNLVASLSSIVGRIYPREIAGKFEPRVSFTANRDDSGSRIRELAGKELPLDFNVLKKAIEGNKPTKKPKKLTEIAANESDDDDDDW